MIRIPEPGRFELRLPDGAANPYAMQAAILAAVAAANGAVVLSIWLFAVLYQCRPSAVCCRQHALAGVCMDAIPHSPNHLLAALSAMDFELLRPHLEAIALVQKTVLVGAGDRLTKVFFPHSGVISLVVSLSCGGMVEVAMIGRDSVFGGSAALDKNISLTDAIVQLSGTASTLDVGILRTVASHNVGFRTTLFRHDQVLFAQAQQSAACNAMHSAESRLARWLLRMHDLAGEDRLHLTQDFLAQMIGVQRNSVSTVALRLQQAGSIKYHRGNIETTNLEALREASCECYRAVNTQYNRLLFED